MGGFCPLVELHREESAPAACAAGLFFDAQLTNIRLNDKIPLYHLPPAPSPQVEGLFLWGTLLIPPDHLARLWMEEEEEDIPHSGRQTDEDIDDLIYAVFLFTFILLVIVLLNYILN